MIYFVIARERIRPKFVIAREPQADEAISELQFIKQIRPFRIHFINQFNFLLS